MKVLLNGSSYSIEDNCSVVALIKNLELNGKYAIEINQTIIPRSKYSNQKINSGDKIHLHVVSLITFKEMQKIADLRKITEFLSEKTYSLDPKNIH